MTIARWEADWMIDTITGPMLGHVQAHAPAGAGRVRWTRRCGACPTWWPLLRTTRRWSASMPAVRAGARRLGEEGFAVLVLGVDLAEAFASRPAARRSWRGSAHPRVLMGRLLAEQMGVRAGDRVAIVGQASMAARQRSLHRGGVHHDARRFRQPSGARHGSASPGPVS